MNRWTITLAAGLMLAFAASAQVHKWTDPSGKVHYGDRPPEDAKSEQLKVDTGSYTGPVQVTDWAAIIRRKPANAPAAGSKDVVMYATSRCVHCKRARAYFAEKGIRYTEVDVEASDANRKEFQELGGRGVPLILVGGKSMRGFSEQAFEALLKKT